MAATTNSPVDEVFKMHQTGQYPYLDVRTPEEFTQGHPSGAVNIPIWVSGGGGMSPNPNFEAEVKKTFSDTTQTIIVGCKSGRRSSAAIDILSKDYPNLVNNASGFDGWLASGFPVAK